MLFLKIVGSKGLSRTETLFLLIYQHDLISNARVHNYSNFQKILHWQNNPLYFSLAIWSLFVFLLCEDSETIFRKIHWSIVCNKDLSSFAQSRFKYRRNTMKIVHLVLFLSLSLLLIEASNAADTWADPGKNLWIGHATLMFVAWLVVFPAGALIAVYRRNIGENGGYFRWAPSFYPPHLYFQGFGILLVIASLIMSARAAFLVYGTGNPFKPVLWDYTSKLYPWNRHVKWGIATLAILVRHSNNVLCWLLL